MRADDVATPEYRALLQQRYEQPGWGGSGHSHLPEVVKFAIQLRATSILDYGCGRGTLKPALQAEMIYAVTEYDPGIVGKDALPDQADLVVCTDVLEHIEPVLLPNVLRHLKELARKGIYLVIGLGPAREILPDGRNAHLIQQPPVWWLDQLRIAGIQTKRWEARKGLNVWAH